MFVRIQSAYTVFGSLFFLCVHQEKTTTDVYLDNINLFSGVAPDFKLLVVSLCILGDADSAHLSQETAREKHLINRLVERQERGRRGRTAAVEMLTLRDCLKL